MIKKAKLEILNGLDMSKFKKQLLQDIGLHYATKSKVYQITLEAALKMSEADLDACFNLIAYTSKSDYEQSKTRWRPKVKKAEMLHVDMRYFLVRADEEDSRILGFASFMLTHEADTEVIYLYEIHLSDPVRRIGLGKHLVDIVSEVGRNAGVEKLMLTVFTRNQHAVDWYSRMGFAVDDSWPEARTLRSGITKQADYRILSRSIS